MMRERCLWVLAAGVMFVVSGVSPGRAYDEPDGFGRAKFGMHAVQVKKFYPKMQASARALPKPDEPKLQLPLTTYTLGNQAVGPLKNCRVEFEFFRDELFEIQFRCPQEDEKKITEYLTSRFGDPKPGSPSSLLWQGTTAGVTCTPQGKVFAFGDIERTKQEQLALMAYAMQFPHPTPARRAPPPQAAPAKPLIASELLRNLTVLAYADPNFGDAPLTVHFTVDLAEELDEPVNPKFSWDFDDDSPRSHDREPTHVFTKPGKYKIRVKVTDANDKSGGDDVPIYVTEEEPSSTPTAGKAPATNTPSAKQDGGQQAH